MHCKVAAEGEQHSCSSQPAPPAVPGLPGPAAAGEGPPATVLQEEERVAAALVHSFEAVDREIMTRCRVEGTKGGATGLVVLRMGGRAGWLGGRAGGRVGWQAQVVAGWTLSSLLLLPGTTIYSARHLPHPCPASHSLPHLFPQATSCMLRTAGTPGL